MIYKEYFDYIKESIIEKENKTYNAKYNNIFNHIRNITVNTIWSLHLNL